MFEMSAVIAELKQGDSKNGPTILLSGVIDKPLGLF